jgi:hypothetical protein
MILLTVIGRRRDRGGARHNRVGNLAHPEGLRCLATGAPLKVARKPRKKLAAA